MRFIFVLFTFLFMSISVFSQAERFIHEKAQRRYIIYLPHAYQVKVDKNFPIVFNFHGGGMTMAEQMFYTGMNETADRNEFIVVYPQGIEHDWNVGFGMSYKNGTDDVGFVDALLNNLMEKYRIDKHRIYATGLSRGGFFSNRLAAELPERFAAIASVGAPLPDSVAVYHKKKIKVSVMTIHGTADSIVKYRGKEKAYFSAEETYNYWNINNGLQNSEEITETIDNLKDDNTSVNINTKKHNGISGILVSINNGGHTWPGRHPFNIGFSLGETTQEIDINDMIWKFFGSHSLNNK